MVGSLPSEVDAAAEAAIQARRTKLTRSAKGACKRIKIVMVCALIIVACGVVALVGGDHRAAEVLFLEALILSTLVSALGIASRRRALRELNAMDRARSREQWH